VLLQQPCHQTGSVALGASGDAVLDANAVRLGHSADSDSSLHGQLRMPHPDPVLAVAKYLVGHDERAHHAYESERGQCRDRQGHGRESEQHDAAECSPPDDAIRSLGTGTRLARAGRARRRRRVRTRAPCRGVSPTCASIVLSPSAKSTMPPTLGGGGSCTSGARGGLAQDPWPRSAVSERRSRRRRNRATTGTTRRRCRKPRRRARPLRARTRHQFRSR
jgi:hypothetical protein